MLCLLKPTRDQRNFSIRVEIVLLTDTLLQVSQFIHSAVLVGLGLVELAADPGEVGAQLALCCSGLLQRRGQLLHRALERRAPVLQLRDRTRVAFTTLLYFLYIFSL